MAAASFTIFFWQSNYSYFFQNMVVLWPNSNLRLKPNNNPARIMTWSRTTFFFFFVDFFCWKNLRVDTNCFSYKLGLGGFFCWKKNSVSRYIYLCIIRLCFAYYAKHKAAELMPSVYFFGKRTEIFFCDTILRGSNQNGYEKWFSDFLNESVCFFRNTPFINFLKNEHHMLGYTFSHT